MITSSKMNNDSSSLDRRRPLGVLGREESVPAEDEADDGERYILGRLGDVEKPEGDIRREPDLDGALEETDDTENEEERHAEGEYAVSHGDEIEDIVDDTELLDDDIIFGKELG